MVKLNPAKGAVRWIDHRSFEFKREFTVSGKVSKARLCITADAVYRIDVDNKAIGSDGDWWRGETYDVSSLLTPGKHVIKAVVKPSTSYSGLLVNLEWKASDGSLKQVNTGADWLCRAVGTKKWLPVSIVGYEGTGPRFRLKDPWLNSRSLICNLKSTERFVDSSNIEIKKTAEKLTLNLKSSLLLTEIRVFAKKRSSYKIQYFEKGKWKNLVEPVKNASEDNLCHAFTPRKLKNIRLISRKNVIKDIKLIKAHGAK